MPANPFSAEGPKPGPFLARLPHRQVVRILRGAGTPEEVSTEVWAHVQETSGYFDPDTLIEPGDVVELDDPAGGSRRRLLAGAVDQHRTGARYLHHVKVRWAVDGEAPGPTASPPAPPGDDLHPRVRAVAAAPLADDRPEVAVRDVVDALEARLADAAAADGAPGATDLATATALLRALAPLVPTAPAAEVLATASLLHRMIDAAAPEAGSR